MSMSTMGRPDLSGLLQGNRAEKLRRRHLEAVFQTQDIVGGEMVVVLPQHSVKHDIAGCTGIFSGFQ